MRKLWNSICLLKFSRTDGPLIIKHVSEDIEVLRKKKSFLSCAFSENIQKQNSIYSYSIHKCLCHTWEFKFGADLYSIVIVVRNSLAYLFLEFFKSCVKHMSDQQPEERIDAIICLLEKQTVLLFG